jgi:hypothetical protein
MSRPRNNYPWSAGESLAFREFPTPSALGEALSAASTAVRHRAGLAMETITHVKNTLASFLGSVETLEAHKERILFIGDYHLYLADIERIKAMLGFDTDLHPPTDEVGAHRTPAWMDRSLSPRAESNLLTWYSADVAIRAWCLARRAEIVSVADA